MKYLNQANEHVKSGPAKYWVLGTDRIMNCCKTDKKRLSKDERLCLEIELFKYYLKPEILELIIGKEFRGVEIQYYQDNTVVNTAIFGNLKVKCPNSLLKYTDKITEVNRNK